MIVNALRRRRKQARQTGQGRTLEYRFRHKNGTWRLLESTANLIRSRKGEPDKFVIVNRDITERREAEKALQESELRQTQRMEAVGRLSGGIAHDFNNLLGVMIGYTDILEMRLREGDPARKTVEEIRKTGQRAAALTRQLLAFSRRQVLEPKVLDLNAVVADIEKMLRRLIGENIELKTVLAPSLGRLLADQGQIEQVILNLAVNARDAMPQGGKLTIETANAVLDDTTRPAHADRAARGLRDAFGQRHGHRDGSADQSKNLRAILHHQGSRQGHRTGPGHHL